jgi:hypothetical protein
MRPQLDEKTGTVPALSLLEPTCPSERFHTLALWFSGKFWVYGRRGGSFWSLVAEIIRGR